MNERLFCFLGGETGPWHVTHTRIIAGEPIANVKTLSVIAGDTVLPEGTSWLLRGVTSNDRYVTHNEKTQLVAKQPPLGRPEATHAAFIPIRKNSVWWVLSQDDRRRIVEEQSMHIKTGLKYLPAIARRLHHCRDIGKGEQFDFLTWFEFAPSHSSAFDALLAELRASPEWRYVEREIEIRLVRNSE